MNDIQKLILIRKIIDNTWEFNHNNGEFLNGILCAIDAVMRMKEENEENAK